jgi:hypothetical protein
VAIYHLDSWITPIGPRQHHVTVKAIAADMQSEDVRMDIAMTIGDAESRRADLMNSIANSLRARGHEIVNVNG